MFLTSDCGQVYIVIESYISILYLPFGVCVCLRVLLLPPKSSSINYLMQHVGLALFIQVIASVGMLV